MRVKWAVNMHAYSTQHYPCPSRYGGPYRSSRNMNSQTPPGPEGSNGSDVVCAGMWLVGATAFLVFSNVLVLSLLFTQDCSCECCFAPSALYYPQVVNEIPGVDK